MWRKIRQSKHEENYIYLTNYQNNKHKSGEKMKIRYIPTGIKDLLIIKLTKTAKI